MRCLIMGRVKQDACLKWYLFDRLRSALVSGWMALGVTTTMICMRTMSMVKPEAALLKSGL